AAALGHVADAEAGHPLGRRAGDVPGLPGDAAAGGANVAHRGADQRRLAHAVPAEQAERDARRDLERAAAQDVAVAVAGVHVGEGQEGAHSASLRAAYAGMSAWERPGALMSMIVTEIRFAH